MTANMQNARNGRSSAAQIAGAVCSHDHDATCQQCLQLQYQLLLEAVCKDDDLRVHLAGFQILLGRHAARLARIPSLADVQKLGHSLLWRTQCATTNEMLYGKI